MMSAIAWRMRPKHGATYFSLLMLTAGVWSFGYLLGFFNTSLVWKMIMLRVEYLGVTSSTVIWIIFVLTYSNYEHWLTKRSLFLLSAIPILTYITILTNQMHGLFYRAYDITTQGDLIVSFKVYGPLFYFWAGYAHLILLFGGVILVWSLFKMPEQYRGQGLLVILIVGIMFLPNFFYIMGANPFSPYDPTPLSFFIVGLLFRFLMHRYQFLDIVPVAYNVIFNNMNSSVIVIDEKERIVDMNPTASSMFENPQEQVLGKSILGIFPDYHEHKRGLENRGDTNLKIEKTIDKNVYEFQISPLKDRSKMLRGWILILYDVTIRKQLEEKQQLLINNLQVALDEIKELSGLLPICANCKKIRDDDGYWHQIETYIEKHSDAQFSHGICQICADELYSDEKWFQKMKSKK